MSTLTYFNGRGRGEIIRIILNYVGETYTDNRIDGISSELKEQLPYGQVPLYDDGNAKLVQSIAIARYIANKYNLLGSNDIDRALADTFVYSTRDLFVPFFANDEVKQKYKNETAPKFLSSWEKSLIKNGGQFLVGKTLTWADLAVFSEIDHLIFHGFNDLIQQYPTLSSFYTRISTQSSPSFKSYLESRLPSKF